MTGSLLLILLLGTINTWSRTDQKHVIISMTKTQCFGACPAYEFELYSDRTASYNGLAFTERKGEWEARLNKKQFDSIIKEFEESDFFKFEDRYYSDITDLPTTYLFYSDGTSEKKVMDYYGAPDELKKLEEKVEELIQQLEWKLTTNN